MPRTDPWDVMHVRTIAAPTLVDRINRRDLETYETAERLDCTDADNTARNLARFGHTREAEVWLSWHACSTADDNPAGKHYAMHPDRSARADGEPDAQQAALIRAYVADLTTKAAH